MQEVLLLATGILTAVFVGVNVGGSSTGVCFGPAVGSDLIGMRLASALMAVVAFVGGVVVGPNVVDTMGRDLVPPSQFTLVASTAILLFTGIGLTMSNYLRISASTSQIAVVAIVGMGVALGSLDWGVFGVILTWWIVSAIIAFWLCVVIGRYLYDDFVSLLDLERRGARVARVFVVLVGCYMAFSAGASNVANAVAPLVGSDALGMYEGVVLAGLAIAVGAFLIGPRTMETIGNRITDMTLEAAMIVELISATIITMLSLAGVPASLAIVATTAVIGLGWGRATRRVALNRDVALGELPDADRRRMHQDRLKLYKLDTSRRIVATWIMAPIVAGLLAYGSFALAVRAGLM
ncbi:MAG: anion permease [Halobacteriota archaeon]